MGRGNSREGEGRGEGARLGAESVAGGDVHDAKLLYEELALRALACAQRGGASAHKEGGGRQPPPLFVLHPNPKPKAAPTPRRRTPHSPLPKGARIRGGRAQAPLM